MPKIYVLNRETDGFAVHKSAKGFVVEHSSQVQAELTGDKYLAPYANWQIAQLGLGKETDLDGAFNGIQADAQGGCVGCHGGTNAQMLCQAVEAWQPPGDGSPLRLLRQGHLVQ